MPELIPVIEEPIHDLNNLAWSMSSGSDQLDTALNVPRSSRITVDIPIKQNHVFLQSSMPSQDPQPEGSFVKPGSLSTIGHAPLDHYDSVLRGWQYLLLETLQNPLEYQS